MPQNPSVNKAILIGTMVRDAELSYTAQKGTAVAKFTLATNEGRRTESGFIRETTYHNCACFGKAAEFLVQSARKGSILYVEGPIQNRKYQDKTGSNRIFSSVLGWKIEVIRWPKDRTSDEEYVPEDAEDITRHDEADTYEEEF